MGVKKRISLRAGEDGIRSLPFLFSFVFTHLRCDVQHCAAQALASQEKQGLLHGIEVGLRIFPCDIALEMRKSFKGDFTFKGSDAHDDKEWLLEGKYQFRVQKPLPSEALPPIRMQRIC